MKDTNKKIKDTNNQGATRSTKDQVDSVMDYILVVR